MKQIKLLSYNTFDSVPFFFLHFAITWNSKTISLPLLKSKSISHKVRQHLFVHQSQKNECILLMRTRFNVLFALFFSKKRQQNSLWSCRPLTLALITMIVSLHRPYFLIYDYIITVKRKHHATTLAVVIAWLRSKLLIRSLLTYLLY